MSALKPKPRSGNYIPNRICEAAEELRDRAGHGIAEPYEEPLADWLDGVAGAWLGSEFDWDELKYAFAVLRVADAILDD